MIKQKEAPVQIVASADGSVEVHAETAMSKRSAGLILLWTLVVSGAIGAALGWQVGLFTLVFGAAWNLRNPFKVRPRTVARMLNGRVLRPFPSAGSVPTGHADVRVRPGPRHAAVVYESPKKSFELFRSADFLTVQRVAEAVSIALSKTKPGLLRGVEYRQTMYMGHVVRFQMTRIAKKIETVRLLATTFAWCAAILSLCGGPQLFAFVVFGALWLRDIPLPRTPTFDVGSGYVVVHSGEYAGAYRIGSDAEFSHDDSLLYVRIEGQHWGLLRCPTSFMASELARLCSEANVGNQLVDGAHPSSTSWTADKVRASEQADPGYRTRASEATPMSLSRKWRATERRLLAWFAGSVVTLPLSYVWAQQLLTRSRFAAVLLGVTACALPYVFGGALFQSFRSFKRKVNLERPVRAALKTDNEGTFLGRLPDLGVGDVTALTTDDLKEIERLLKE